MAIKHGIYINITINGHHELMSMAWARYTPQGVDIRQTKCPCLGVDIHIRSWISIPGVGYPFPGVYVHPRAFFITD